MTDGISAPLAYLVSRYPAISHTFILREISRLRLLGHRIHTASINAPDRSIDDMDPVERGEALATYFVGQGVGLMNKVKPAREVVREFIEDYVSAAERLAGSLDD